MRWINLLLTFSGLVLTTQTRGVDGAAVEDDIGLAEALAVRSDGGAD